MDRRSPGSPRIVDLFRGNGFRFMISIFVINIIIVSVLYLCTFKPKNAVEAAKKELIRVPTIKEVKEKDRRINRLLNQRIAKDYRCNACYCFVTHVVGLK